MAAPILTNTINQSGFIDALSGAQNIQDFLTNFPETVYSKSIDSHLFLFMSALLGASGAGLVKQQYFEQRAQAEASALSGTSLDALYTAPFGFGRLASETYTLDLSSQLLSSAQRTSVLTADASFRNRARLWMQATRAGGSALGIALAASSGLGQSVEAVENYKALYDQYTDMPLRLPYLGSTVSLDEVILIPRNSFPQNSTQALSFNPYPTSGTFTITVPVGPPYTQLSQSLTFNTNGTVTVPSSSFFKVGSWFSGPNIASYGDVWQCTAILGATLIAAECISLTPPVPYTGTQTTITGPVYISQAQTSPIAYDASANDVRNAIGALPIVGGIENVFCSGGPLPTYPVEITFIGKLANTTIGTLIVNSGSDSISGSVGLAPSTQAQMQSGAPSLNVDGLKIQFAASDLSPMLDAVDVLHPQTSLISIQEGRSTLIRQPVNLIYTDQSYAEVITYVTGSPTVNWPPVDGVTSWIQSSVEHEAPKLSNTYVGQYTNFHNISNVIAYNDQALNDPNYNSPSLAPVQPFYAAYYDTNTGTFNQVQQLLYPFLAQYQSSALSFQPQYAVAPQPNPPIMTAVTSQGVGIIDDSYPASYLNLPGINYQPNNQGPFWSSAQRTSGTDYLEIDLGSVRPVNFIYFEATNKPYSISVAYEILDQPVYRQFMTATIANTMPSVTSLAYSASQMNPWTTVFLPITNSIATMPYTRYIRIGFTRTSSGEPFMLGPNPVPYSIEIRNLRVGRVVNNSI